MAPYTKSSSLNLTIASDWLFSAIKAAEDAGASALVSSPAVEKSNVTEPENIQPKTALIEKAQPQTADKAPKSTGKKPKNKQASKEANSKAENENGTSNTKDVPSSVIQESRKLVTVKKIDKISNWDRLNNLIQIEGWSVVVSKEKNVREGELVVFVEVDTFLPAGGPHEKHFAEVGKPITFEGEKGYCVTTKQIKNPSTQERLISQGHIYKLLRFHNIYRDVEKWKEISPDTIRDIDYISFLGPGVRKWVSDAERALIEGTVTGPAAQYAPFPSFIQKTITDRVQNCHTLFIKPKYQKYQYQESIKMDGASMTIYFVSNTSRYHSLVIPTTSRNTNTQYTHHATGRLGVCSKEKEIFFDNTNTYWRTALLQNYHTLLPRLNQTIAIQGELVGDKIQGNPYEYPADHTAFFIYSIFSIEGSRRWKPQEVEAFALEHGLLHVPVVGYGIIPKMADDHEDLLIRADLMVGDEGLVFKNCEDGRWFKVLSRTYPLEKEQGFQGPTKADGDDEEEEEDVVQGWVMDEAEVLELCRAWEEGELDGDEEVQAWMKEWTALWEGALEAEAEPATVKHKTTAKELRTAYKEDMKDVIAWLQIRD